MVRKTRRKNGRKMNGGMEKRSARGRTLKVANNGNRHRRFSPRPPTLRSHFFSHDYGYPHTANSNDHYVEIQPTFTAHRPSGRRPPNQSFAAISTHRTLVDTQELIGVIHQLQYLEIFLDQEIRYIESQQVNVPDNEESGGDLLPLLREKQRISIEIQNMTSRLKKLIPEINIKLGI